MTKKIEDNYFGEKDIGLESEKSKKIKNTKKDSYKNSLAGIVEEENIRKQSNREEVCAIYCLCFRISRSTKEAEK